MVGGAVGLAKAGQILYKAFTAAKKVMSSAWYLTGYGKLPRYAMQWGVIRTTGASALVGATSNSLIDYVGQKENIALANSLYFYNPDMQSVFSMDEVVGAAAAGALFGASLGMIGHVISTVAVRGNNAAARNAFAQQGMDPAFAPQQLSKILLQELFKPQYPRVLTLRLWTSMQQPEPPLQLLMLPVWHQTLRMQPTYLIIP